jgi:hypothetical protein
MKTVWMLGWCTLGPLPAGMEILLGWYFDVIFVYTLWSFVISYAFVINIDLYHYYYCRMFE